MNKKKSIIIGILILVLIVILGITWNKKTAQAPAISSGVPSASTPTSTSTSTPMQNTSSTPSSTVSVVIQKTYTGSSFSFNYPSSWSVTSQNPLSIDNFNGKYQKGGVIPVGGASVYVVTTTVEGSDQDIINTETMNAFDIATSTATVNGTSCQKVTYDAKYAAGSTSKDISLYCLRGTELWKIYLSYGANDPAEKVHISDFAQVITSLKLF